MYALCRYCGVCYLWYVSLLFFMTHIVDGEGHKGTKGALAHSAACVILAKHSTECAINICWHASILLYRRGQNAELPTCAVVSRTIPRIYIIYPSATICYMHPGHPCITLSLHTSVCAVSTEKHNHENHHVAVIYKKNCTSFPLPPSPQKTIKTWKACGP